MIFCYYLGICLLNWQIIGDITTVFVDASEVAFCQVRVITLITIAEIASGKPAQLSILILIRFVIAASVHRNFRQKTINILQFHECSKSIIYEILFTIVVKMYSS